MSGDLVFATRGLSITRQGRTAPVPLVDDLNLSVHRGEVMAIVGETGAGKTLSMKAILGLLPAGVEAEGWARLADDDWLRLDSTNRMRQFLGSETGMVLQNPAGMFDPLVRLRDQLIEGVGLRRKLSRPDGLMRAAHLLNLMGFDDSESVLDLYPHQLSGGMAQRAAIAMALMPQPLLLVVDEPTSALDAHVRVEVLRLLREATMQQQSALVLVSHDLGLVSHFAESIAVMYAGHVIEQGPADTVLSFPQHPYTRALLAASVSLDASPRQPLDAIGGVHPRPGAWPAGCVFAPRCPLAFTRCRSEAPRLQGRGPQTAACYLADNGPTCV